MASGLAPNIKFETVQTLVDGRANSGTNSGKIEALKQSMSEHL